MDHRDDQRVGRRGTVAAGGGAERVQGLGRRAGGTEPVGLGLGDAGGEDVPPLELVGVVEVGLVAPDRGGDGVGGEADVERGEVQPERAHLPQQVLDRAVGHRLAAGGVAHQLEVAPQLGRLAVGERAVGLLGARDEPLGDVVELGPQRLVPAPLAEPARDLGHQRHVAPQAGLQGGAAGAHLVGALRGARGEPLDPLAQQPHGDAPVQVDGGGERGGGDAGVPVHVAAGPARELDGGEVERLAAEAALELAHQLGHGVVQHAVEEVQVAAHLVVDLRALAPDLGGLPPQRERLADAVDHAGAGGGPEPLVVELGDLGADVAGVLHHRPAGGLGGVRGEREVEPQVVQRARRRLRRARGQALGRLGQRLALRRPLGALVAAPPPHPLARLGQVGQVQLHRARADHVERVAAEDLLDQRGGVLVRPGLARPHPRRRLAQPHHRLPQALTALPGDRLLEQPGEDPRVTVQRGPGGSIGDRHARSLATTAPRRRPGTKGGQTPLGAPGAESRDVQAFRRTDVARRHLRGVRPPLWLGGCGLWSRGFSSPCVGGGSWCGCSGSSGGIRWCRWWRSRRSWPRPPWRWWWSWRCFGSAERRWWRRCWPWCWSAWSRRGRSVGRASRRARPGRSCGC